MGLKGEHFQEDGASISEYITEFSNIESNISYWAFQIGIGSGDLSKIYKFLIEVVLSSCE